MNYHFRKYTDDDHPEISIMINSLYNEDSYGEPITEEKINLTLHELSEKPKKGYIYIFLSEKCIVGYSILINYWSNEYGGNILCIDEFYVKSSFRNKGIGSAFLTYIDSNFDSTTKMFQLEVTTINKKALEYYKNHGFSISENHHLIKKVK